MKFGGSMIELMAPAKSSCMADVMEMRIDSGLDMNARPSVGIRRIYVNCKFDKHLT